MNIIGYAQLKKLHRKEPLGLLYHVDQYVKKSYGVLAIIYVVSCIAVFITVIVMLFIGVSKPDTSKTTTPTVQAAVVLPDPCDLIDVYCDGEPMPVSGKASWLVYQLPDTCATRDWPKGTRLYIQRSDDPIIGTDCVVRDFGPALAVHPDRIVDLDSRVFSKIAPLSSGVVDVTVTEL